MPKFRAMIFSPAFAIVRRYDIEAEDEFTAVEVAQFNMDDRGHTDPDAIITIREVETKS